MGNPASSGSGYRTGNIGAAPGTAPTAAPNHKDGDTFLNYDNGEQWLLVDGVYEFQAQICFGPCP